MAKIFRWHISRLFESERAEGEPRLLSVTVTPQFMHKDILEEAEVKDLEGLALVPSDDLAWWNLDTEIEGAIEEPDLIQALVERNVRPVSAWADITKGKPADMIQERQLEEDMVFLQIFENEADVPHDLVERFRNDDSFPNVKELLRNPSKWLDFTPQARQMSAEVYRKALGEDVRSSGGSQ